MKSPFPGMDPYLEARWSDVHGKLVIFLGETLQPLLPSDLRARTEERPLLEETTDGDEPVDYRGDVVVVRSPRRQAEPVAQPMATLEPIMVKVERRTVVDRSVQIIDVTAGNRVVAANRSPQPLE